MASFLFAMGVMYHFSQSAPSLGDFFLCHHLDQFLIMILSANIFAGKMERPVLYQSKNKGPPVQMNRVSSCSTGGRGAIRDAVFASASPATPSRRPDRVLFEILRQKLSCNEFPALQSVFSDFSTGLQPAFAFRYPVQHEQDPKESMKASISKIFFDIRI
jgi:hypothetical protein